jgi:hypothetical protein
VFSSVWPAVSTFRKTRPLSSGALSCTKIEAESGLAENQMQAIGLVFGGLVVKHRRQGGKSSFAMKRLLLTLISFVGFCSSSHGQGSLLFDTSVPGQVNAPVTRDSYFGPTTGRGPGAGYTAQLFLVGAGGSLTPLLPATTFKTSSAADEFFVNPVVVTVPGVPPGSPATLQMRMWDSSRPNYDLSTFRGQSANFTATVGGDPLPPANLMGLQPFSFPGLPEPGTVALSLLGAAALLLGRRKF